jgi:regulatory protein
MQLSLALPLTFTAISINNRGMSAEKNAIEKQKEAAKKLRNKALRLLTTREHSREELLKKLERSRTNAARRQPQQSKKSKPTEDDPDPSNKDDIERIVAQLTAEGWQSDDRYADAMVRRLTGQASKRFIAGKLAQAGIKKDDAETALAQLVQDDFEAATALWKRRFGDTPRDDKERQKQIRYLLVRGFGLGDAFKIVPPPAKILPPIMKFSSAPTSDQPTVSKIAPRRSALTSDVEAVADAAVDEITDPATIEAPEFVDSVRSSSLWSKSDGTKKQGSKSSFGQRKSSFGKR